MSASPDPDKAPVHFTLKPKEFERVNPASDARAPDSIEVKDLLKINMAYESKTSPAVELPAKRASRKPYEYALLMILVNGTLGALILFAPKVPTFYVPGGAGMVLFSVGLTWMMWVVMDKY